jgi:HD-like signal output (HDOD) protein
VVSTLAAELEQVPANRAAALRVVQMVDDPRVGSSDVAASVSLDPALTARVLQVANSAYYGMSGRIRTTAFGVTVLGFQTVRSLAAIAAAGVSGNDALPKGFWTRCAAAASGGSILAARAGASAPDAFCVGMLHDLGSVLLWKRDPAAYEALPAPTPGRTVLSVEQEAYGIDHASLCAQVLTAWCVPDDLCSAIGNHHEVPSDTAPPLRKALQAGIALGRLAQGDRDPVHRSALHVIGVTDREMPDLIAQVEEATRQLAAVLAS